MSTDVGAKKRAGIVLLILGIILVLLAVFGGGPERGDVTGVRAIIITLGVLVAVTGGIMTRKKGHISEPPS